MKVRPLTSANLKGFARNWKSVVLLLGIPIILITLIFTSFNPDGIQKIPVGMVVLTDFDMEEYQPTFFPYLWVSYYASRDNCKAAIKEYRQYACLLISGDEQISITIYYDNTRDPIIWEIIQRIKTSVSRLQDIQSQMMAQGIQSDATNTLPTIQKFKQKLGQTNTQISDYIVELDNSASKMSNARSELSSTLYQMNQDLNDIDNTKDDLQYAKNQHYQTAKDNLYYMNMYINSLYSVSGAEYYAGKMKEYVDKLDSEVNYYNNKAEDEFGVIDNKIYSYRQAKNSGDRYVEDLNLAINEVQGTKSDLKSAQKDISLYTQEIATIEKKIENIGGMDTDLLLNPIVVFNEPTFIPDWKGDPEDANEQTMVQAFNLIGLQTLYPTILFLNILFLSILISSFITLKEINSIANIRRQLVKGIFFPEIISTFISAIIITSVPILCVMAAGQYLFGLKIMENVIPVTLIVFMVTTIFVMIGMILTYLIRKESITLLVATFTLIFFMFFSGFLLPIERMSSGFYVMANFLPSKIGLSSFNRIVFYSQAPSGFELAYLLIWAVTLFSILVLVKWLKTDR